MRKNYLISIIWVKFCFNFPEPELFIDWICDNCKKNYLKSHLTGKFNHLYDEFGSDAVMNRFLIELDGDLQESLVDYAINVWGKIGMATKYKELMNL